MHLRNRHHISRQPPAPKRTSKPYHKNGWRRRCRRQQHSPHTTQTNAACRPRQTARVHPTSGADGGVAAADNIGPDRQAFDQSSFTSIFRTILIRNSEQGLCFKRWLVRREVESGSFSLSSRRIQPRSEDRNNEIVICNCDAVPFWFYRQ